MRALSAIQHTCTKPHHRPGNDEYVSRNASWDSPSVAIKQTEDHVQYQSSYQRLSCWSLVCPESKDGRGHKLTKAVRSHYPSQEESGSMCIVHLRGERVMKNRGPPSHHTIIFDVVQMTQYKSFEVVKSNHLHLYTGLYIPLTVN